MLGKLVHGAEFPWIDLLVVRVVGLMSRYPLVGISVEQIHVILLFETGWV